MASTRPSRIRQPDTPKPAGALECDVLVLAHGPSRVTLRACRQFRAMIAPGSTVTVVADTEPGHSGVARAREQGFAAAPGHGPEAVARALGGLGDRAILVVHDDISIDAASLAAMGVTHRRTQQVIVPGTAPGPESRPGVASLACAVGSREPLIELALHSGFSPGHELAADVVVAADTRHAHAFGCASRLATPDPEADRPLLVAAMIARDEEEYLQGCLESLAGVVDRIELADTGSTDRTPEIAAAAGAFVTSIEWRDDFAWARNQVLDRCRDAEYVLWIDADERLHCPQPERFRQLLHTMRAHYPSYRVQVRNTGEDGEVADTMWAKRLFTSDGVEFVGALHEQVMGADGNELIEAGLQACAIDHLGYQDAVIASRDKFERNLGIAEQAYLETPNVDTRAELYRSLARGADSPQEALARMDELVTDFSEFALPRQVTLLVLRANVCLELEDNEEAEATARRAADLVPADMAARAVLAEALIRQGRPQELVDAVADLSCRASTGPAGAVNRPAERGVAWSLLRAHAALGNTEAALELVGQVPPDEDPWPVLVGCAADHGAELAAVAARRQDGRFGDAAAACLDVAHLLPAWLAAFREHGGLDQHASRLIEAAERAEKLAEAPALREDFLAAPRLEPALAYAEAAVTGFGDLSAELRLQPADRPDEERLAESLAIAADAHARRGDGEVAVADAIEALQIWPGSVRAGVLAAAGAVGSDMPEVALDIVEVVRASQPDRVGRRQTFDLANIAIEAHLARGAIREAVAEAGAVLDGDGNLETWDSLVAASADDLAHFSLVLTLALRTDGIAFIDAARHALANDRLIATCLSYLEAGGTGAAAITTGLVAAAVQGRDDLAELFLPYRDLLDQSDLGALVTVLQDADHAALADRLATVAS